MTDKEIVERAKEAEKKTDFGELVHSPISKGVNSAFGIGFIEGMVEYRNSLQKDSVSEDLEQEAERYRKEKGAENIRYFECARHFANWQKEQMMAKAVDVTIAIPYPRRDGGYSQLVDSKEALPLGDNIKVLVIKED